MFNVEKYTVELIKTFLNDNKGYPVTFEEMLHVLSDYPVTYYTDAQKIIENDDIFELLGIIIQEEKERYGSISFDEFGDSVEVVNYLIEIFLNIIINDYLLENNKSYDDEVKSEEFLNYILTR